MIGEINLILMVIWKKKDILKNKYNKARFVLPDIYNILPNYSI